MCFPPAWAFVVVCWRYPDGMEIAVEDNDAGSHLDQDGTLRARESLVQLEIRKSPFVPEFGIH